MQSLMDRSRLVLFQVQIVSTRFDSLIFLWRISSLVLGSQAICANQCLYELPGYAPT